VLARRVGDLAGAATIPASEITLTTWPRPAAIIGCSAATVPFIVPAALIVSIVALVGSSCSQARPVERTPALLTQRSSPPASARTSAVRASQAAASRTSRTAPLAPLPSVAAVRVAAAPSMSVAQTAKPRPASSVAIALPSPLPAPVTTAVRIVATIPRRDLAAGGVGGYHR
jgi:hypothetical protein